MSHDSGATIGAPLAPATMISRRVDHTAGQNLQPTAPPIVRFASSSQLTKASPTFSLESPPASGDFDWDERNVSNGDGMASLTNRSSRGGYLGVASGAALLRLADSDAQPASVYGMENEAIGDDSTRVPTPIPQAIYSLSQLEPFVDAYFQLYHVSYPIVHEATFRAQVSTSTAPCWAFVVLTERNAVHGNHSPPKA